VWQWTAARIWAWRTGIYRRPESYRAADRVKAPGSVSHPRTLCYTKLAQRRPHLREDTREDRRARRLESLVVPPARTAQKKNGERLDMPREDGQERERYNCGSARQRTASDDRHKPLDRLSRCARHLWTSSPPGLCSVLAFPCKDFHTRPASFSFWARSVVRKAGDAAERRRANSRSLYDEGN
jgi:hypothetical protein